MPVITTGNASVDDATAEIALALRDGDPRKRDQHYYDEAMRLRDAIMQGTRELDQAVPGGTRKQAAEVLAGFGLDPGEIERVLRRASGHLSASFFVHGDHDRLGHVDYDREQQTYTVRTPAGDTVGGHTATEITYCGRCGQDHTATSAERLNAAETARPPRPLRSPRATP